MDDFALALFCIYDFLSKCARVAVELPITSARFLQKDPDKLAELVHEARLERCTLQPSPLLLHITQQFKTNTHRTNFSGVRGQAPSSTLLRPMVLKLIEEVAASAQQVSDGLLSTRSPWAYLPLDSPHIASPLTPGVWTQPTKNNVCFWDDTSIELDIDYPGTGLGNLMPSGLPSEGQGKSTSILFSSLSEGTSIRIDQKRSALVIVDMQNFFLHPDLRERPVGRDCVAPILSILPACRANGIKIIWLNWGLRKAELRLLTPSHTRTFCEEGFRGLGSKISSSWGRLLVRDAPNAALYPPLQDEFFKGSQMGTDFLIHKNRMSGLWGEPTELSVFLQNHGISTLFFAGLNADQCVPGTFVDAYYKGYDCIMLKDAVSINNGEANTQPMSFNGGTSYGFVTDTYRLLDALENRGL
jgi:nicotinamidase-related amidase